jgi:hypothetical protein
MIVTEPETLGRHRCGLLLSLVKKGAPSELATPDGCFTHLYSPRAFVDPRG